MKRKILVVLLSLVSVFCLAFAFTACANLGGLFGGGGLGGGSFTLDNVKRIELGDYYYDVRNYLGEPDEGEEYATTWVYYGSNYKSLMAQDEKLQEDLLNASSEKEVEDILKKLLELEESFANLTYNYCAVTFDGGTVTKVEFDAKKSESGTSNSKTSKSISLSTDTALLYTDLSEFNQIIVKIDYTDGSYKLDKLPASALNSVDTAQLGDQNINWSDNWAEYTGKFNIANTITLSDNGIKYKLTVKDGSTAENHTVVATVSGKGTMGDFRHMYTRFVDEIIIEKGITALGNNAFYTYWYVSRISIPDSVTYIEYGVFGDCGNLEYIEVASGNKNYSSEGGIIYDKAKTEIIYVPWGIKGDVTIADGVTSIGIGSRAFSRCENITGITIPASVTSIGEEAFDACRKLESVVIKDNSKLTTIDVAAFRFCEQLKSITIPASVTTIGEGAFRECTSLTSVSFGKNSKLATIGEKAFYGCRNIESLSIPSSVTEIGEGAFAACWKLKSIVIPNGITSICKDMFSGDSNLESIVIAASVTSIGNNAFSNCKNLKTIYYYGTAAQWSDISIGNGNNYLQSANTYYYSESNPGENAGNFWHYVNGEPVAW